MNDLINKKLSKEKHGLHVFLFDVQFYIVCIESLIMNIQSICNINARSKFININEEIKFNS